MVLGALLAPASAHAQKPFFDIRRAEPPTLQSTRPLTGPARGDRVAHALAFARAHARALGLTAARAAALGPPARSTVSGIERLTWQRSYGGIPAFGDELRVALGPDGAVLSASGDAGEGTPPSLTPSLGAAQAMAVVSDDAGAATPPRVVSGPRGARRTTTFAGGGRAELVVFGSRLAWRVGYAFYDTVVDATNGAILRRVSLVKSDAPAHVWDDYPGGSPTHDVDLEAVGYLPAGAASLQNDWMRVFADADGSDTQDPGEEISLTGMPFDFQPFPGCDAAKPCAWDPTTPTSWTTNRSQVAVQAFYLANRFREYLLARTGFDGFGHSVPPLNIETDYGAGFAAHPEDARFDFNNSAIVIPARGSAGPWAMELSLFGARFADGDHGFRAMDAGDDASIVNHEYSHGYTNQTVVDGTGYEALDDPQALAIDEASADFFAKSYLVDNALEVDTGEPGQIDMGGYTDRVLHSIRAEPIDCPVSAPAAEPCPHGGLTYADYGRIIGFPEAHYDGEIWSETMWDLRGTLGSVRTTELIAKALAIVPPQPTFLDMRDAILTVASAGETGRIWQVFAARGMGCDAATTRGFDDVHPQAGFNVPPCAVATPTPTPAQQPTATPVATPTPPPPPRRPSFTLRRSGRRAVKFTVTCHAACSVTASLRVSRSVAKRLHLGSRPRTIGTVDAKLTAAGRRTFTVRLSRTAARALKRARKVKSFRATLTARAGTASRHRTVTVRR